MAKSSGGVRMLKIGSKEYRKRQSEINDMIASGKIKALSCQAVADMSLSKKHV